MPECPDSSQVAPVELAVTRAWADQLTAGQPPSIPAGGAAGAPVGPDLPQGPARRATEVPFSFLCGSRSSRQWVSGATATCEAGDGDGAEWEDGRRCRRLRWRDPDTSLCCLMELTEYAAYPALEWVVYLRNEGPRDSAPVAGFKALDLWWAAASADQMPVLGRALGSDGRHDDFQYVREELRQSMWDAPRTVRMDSASNAAFRKARNGSPSFLLADGRPSATWLPFFELSTGDDGLICALGWSGQWFAQFAHDGHGRTDIEAGMEHLELCLRPGEQIRSPRVLVLYWQGTPLHAHNLFRQFLLAHHSPRLGGQPAQVPICNSSWGGTPTAGHLDAIERISSNGLQYEYYWVDAGWYGTSTKPCPDVFHGDWGITGDWRVNPNYHPDGLKPVSDAAHRAGMKFLLWLEPERARQGTPVTLEHPEWFLRRTDVPPQPNEDVLLNLGDPAAWQWAVDTVSGLIADNGIDCYREDFNTDPGPFWANADRPGRKGIVEMRFVEGLYAFWDELRRRHPDLLIDNCASGGRRLELETIGRSVALWRTDYNCFPHVNPDATQLHTAGLALWLPLNATSPMVRPGDTYQARSAYSAGLVLNVDEYGMGGCQRPDFPWDWFRDRIAEARRLRPSFLGDFYPLTPCVVDPEAWMAFQLLVPATGSGAVLAFRRPGSPMAAATFRLRGLRAAAEYQFECADTGRVWQAAGCQLMDEGLSIALATPRSSCVLYYQEAS